MIAELIYLAFYRDYLAGISGSDLMEHNQVQVPLHCEVAGLIYLGFDKDYLAGPAVLIHLEWFMGRWYQPS